MNKLALFSLLLLSACSSREMFGESDKPYNHQSVENKVGPNGELISPPNCPDWSASPYSTTENAKQGNFSCAYVTNLGLMLEDPRDLERGASGGHIKPDPVRSARAVEKYRSGETDAKPSATAADMMGIEPTAQ